MALDKVYVAAMTVSFGGALLLVISLSTASWLVNGRNGVSDQFVNGGLWSVCFNRWNPSYDSLEKQYDGCYYVFEQELEYLRPYLLKGWFVGTQVLISLSTFVLLLAGLIQFLHFMRFIEHPLIMRLGSAIVSFFIAILLGVGVIMYGVRSSDALWMPNPERNALSYSFILAAFSILIVLVAAMLFIVTALTTRYQNKYSEDNDYRMEPRY